MQPTSQKHVYINCSLFDVFFLTITHFLFEGCDTLMYDNICAPCPTNCEDNICHRQHGTCFACKPDWVGMFCNKSMINEIIQLISTFDYFLSNKAKLRTNLRLGTTGQIYFYSNYFHEDVICVRVTKNVSKLIKKSNLTSYKIFIGTMLCLTFLMLTKYFKI